MSIINRAVKCATIEGQLKSALSIAEKADMHGLEIQELAHLMEKHDFKERGKLVTKACEGHAIKHLVYHYPIKASWDSIQEAKSFDLASEEGNYILALTKDTMEEAAYVAGGLGLENATVNVHLLGFTEKNNISKDERDKKLKIGEIRLEELKTAAENFSGKYGCRVSITRENNPPDHGTVHGILDFDARDITRTANIGICTNLDFAHFWQYENYRKNSKGELPGVDFAKTIYKDNSLESMIETVAPSLELLHMCDAKGYMNDSEGLEVGTGDIPHSMLIPLIAEKARKDIVGTYEIRDGHIYPETMLRSDSYYRSLFGKDFDKYFK